MRVKYPGNHLKICGCLGNRHLLFDTENRDLRYRWATLLYDKYQLLKVGRLIDCAAGKRKQPRKAIPDKAIFNFIIGGTGEIIFQTDLLDRNRAKKIIYVILLKS